jgi:uncharacterized integral membrane protein
MGNLTFKHIFSLTLIALLLVFVAQNLETTKVKFLFFGFELPLVILIGSVFLIGLFAGITLTGGKEKNIKKTEENKN